MKFRLPGGKSLTTSTSVLPLLGKLVRFQIGDSDNREEGLGVVKRYVSSDRVELALAIPGGDGKALVLEVTAIVEVSSCSIVTDLIASESNVKGFFAQTSEFKAVEDSKDAKGYTVVKNGDVVVDYQNVVFEGFASTFKSVTPADRDGDYVQPGAFADTLVEFRKNAVMLTDHRNSVANLVGSYSKIGTNAAGLVVTGNVSNAPDEYTKRTRFLIVEGHLKSMSMGGFFFYGADGRAIEKVKLLEITLTPVPANQDALFGIKSPAVELVCKAYRYFS